MRIGVKNPENLALFVGFCWVSVGFRLVSHDFPSFFHQSQVSFFFYQAFMVSPLIFNGLSSLIQLSLPSQLAGQVLRPAANPNLPWIQVATDGLNMSQLLISWMSSALGHRVVHIVEN